MHRLRRVSHCGSLLVAAVALVGAKSTAQCREWTPGFHASGVNAPVLAPRAFDDGSGTRLYAGGSFSIACQTAASRVARFDGSAWSVLGAPLANGVNQNVNALVEHDDGVFGDGVRCVDGALIRLAIKQNAGGASQFPEPGNLSVSFRGATPPGSGLTGWYQTYYRSASPTFCPPATFNVTNGVMIRW